MCQPRFFTVAYCILWVMCLEMALAVPTLGQETELQDPVVLAWGRLAHMNECANCHYRGAEPNPLAPHSGEFSRRSEAKHWVRQDKHAIARRRVEPLTRQQLADEVRSLRGDGLGDAELRAWLGLSNELSRQICDRLGYDVTTDEGYALFRDNCLGCHGGYAGSSQNEQFSRTEPGRFHAESQQPGISCNYCHQVGDQTRWIEEHVTPVNWRLLPPQQKSQRGMRDLISLASQAALCCDCHMGNIAQNKFVTHEMYAAGHPPLPSFELQTFCDFMPQHWRTPGQLYAALDKYERREEYFAINYPQLFGARRLDTNPADECWKTRKVIAGALQARQRSLELVIQAAETKQWGDYALYDCAACHHELRADSRRQRKGFAQVPGRPRQLAWPLALGKIAQRYGDEAAPTTGAQSALVAAFDQRPFGDPQRCAAAAREALAELQLAQTSLESQSLDANRARAFFVDLSRIRPSYLIDYHSARQVLWAMRRVSSELGEKKAPLPKSVDELLSSGEDVVDGISTRLPAGRDRFIYRAYLKQELSQRGDYVPDQFAERLEQIQALLDTK